MFHGVINLYKEKGYTSNDAVNVLKGITGQKKIGHAGTLDPNAVGVLPICLGAATKIADMLLTGGKTYEAVMLLGLETDTQDVWGRELERGDISHLTADDVSSVTRGFVGKSEQIPPMYSAVKVGGRRLYDLARQGLTVERKPRVVTIESIDIKDISLPRVRFAVTCSGGTYVRTLCHDIGRKLGCGACMESLTRLRAGMLELKDSLTIDDLRALKDEGRLGGAVIPIDSFFPDYPRVQVTDEAAGKARNGNPLYTADVRGSEKGQVALKDGNVRVYGPEGDFLAIYIYRAREDMLFPVKMFPMSL